MYAYETMKPTSESPGAQEARYLCVAEGSCVSVRTGDELSEANDQPQSLKRLKSIRPGKLTSRRTGGICVKAGVPDEVLGMSHDASHNKPRFSVVSRRLSGVWIEDGQKVSGLSKDPCVA
jgi:acetamidase/formamidase